jgi:hypothetical protein
MLLFTGITLGLGFLAKYQMLVAGLLMLIGIVAFAQKPLKVAFKRFSLAVVAAVLIVVPWIVVAYNVFRYQLFDQWFYAMSLGNPERAIYSTRYPIPIFYFIEMVWPYSHFHPISIFLYALCLLGLVFMVWRHRREDKFVLLWFSVVFVFFTCVANREWRYVTALFPALAISASVVILSFAGSLRNALRSTMLGSKKWLVKVSSVVLAVAVVGAMGYSAYDTYTFASDQQITVDIKGVASYVIENIEPGRAIMVLCPVNLFNYDTVQFYLWAQGDRSVDVLQYPELPADVYRPEFNITELIELCKENSVQYVMFFEYGNINRQYFDSDLTCQKIYEQLCFSDSFSEILEDQIFGEEFRHIFVMTFTG